MWCVCALACVRCLCAYLHVCTLFKFMYVYIRMCLLMFLFICAHIHGPTLSYVNTGQTGFPPTTRVHLQGTFTCTTCFHMHTLYTIPSNSTTLCKYQILVGGQESSQLQCSPNLVHSLPVAVPNACKCRRFSKHRMIDGVMCRKLTPVFSASSDSQHSLWRTWTPYKESEMIF